MVDRTTHFHSWRNTMIVNKLLSLSCHMMYRHSQPLLITTFSRQTIPRLSLDLLKCYDNTIFVRGSGIQAHQWMFLVQDAGCEGTIIRNSRNLYHSLEYLHDTSLKSIHYRTWMRPRLSWKLMDSMTKSCSRAFGPDLNSSRDGTLSKVPFRYTHHRRPSIWDLADF